MTHRLYRAIIILMCLPLTPLAQNRNIIFKDAIALWHMNKGEGLVGKGSVELDIPLEEEAKQTSLLHGGDGRVATFNGGYLVAGDSTLHLTGYEMTIIVRFCNQGNNRSMPLLAKDNSNDPYNLLIYEDNGLLNYCWQTSPAINRVVQGWTSRFRRPTQDFLDGILRLAVPTDLIGRDCWHDVVIRFRKTVVEMFVDGVLVDEEWPHGQLFNFQGPLLFGAGFEKNNLMSGFTGMIDHIALWNRALSNNEITLLSGGAEWVARRKSAILGPRSSTIQYWHPRGYNTTAGDAMCFFKDSLFHVFYLYDRRHHGSKWGMGAHQYSHVTSRDLVHWKFLPRAIPISHQWECSNGTGEIAFYKGIYYCFYTDAGHQLDFKDKPHRGAGIFMATSKDGIHFAKSDRPLLPGGDCSIFQDEVTGLFHLITNGVNEQGESGLIDFISADLQSWTKQNDLLIKENGACPHLFKWNNWYYLTVGGRFWRAKSLKGPWIINVPAKISLLAYPKTAGFINGRRLAAGWVGDKGWGGDLVMIELVQNSDGSLGTKFVPEMIPPSGEPLVLPISTGFSWRAVHPREATGKNAERLVFEHTARERRKPVRTIELDGKNGFSSVMMDQLPQDIRITMKVTASVNTVALGICVRAEGDYEKGCELQFKPSDSLIQFSEPENGMPASTHSKGRIFLNGIQGLNRSFTLDIVVKGSIIDACIGDRHTMIRRYYGRGDRLFFFVLNGKARFEDLKIQPLL